MRSSHLFVVALLAFAAALILPGAALAHERRAVGKYTLVVGFIVEPAIEGQPNGIDLRITDAASNAPAEGVERTLKAAIAFGGGQPKAFPLRARFGQPGAYTADLIPTRSGSYTLTFTGDIAGQAVNEKFESGPGRFSDIESAQTLQFPEPIQGTSELQRSVTALERRVVGAEEQAADAEAQAGTARSLGIGGLVIGGLGLAAGVYGVMSGRRREAPLGGQAMKAK